MSNTTFQQLTVTQAAEARVSIRKYTDETVSDETINELIRVAGTAPTPWNLQPWRIIAVKDKDTLAKLQEAAYGQRQVGGSAVTFVIATDMDDVIATLEDTVHPGMADRVAETAKSIRDHFAGYSAADLHWWGRSQGYTFMAYLLLAAQSHGYATSPMLGFDPAKVKEMFGLGENVQIPAIVSLGRPAEDGFPQFRHPLDRYVKIV